MKKQELESVLQSLTEVQKYASNQEYNVYTYINTRISKAINAVNEELERLAFEDIDINCPALDIITVESQIQSELQEKLNAKLKELVINDYKIIDFGLYKPDTSTTSAFIKYTS